MSFIANPSEPRSHPSAAYSLGEGTSRCEISIVSFTTFAQRIECISTSPRRAEGRRDIFQKRPSRSGNAATEWLPVVIVNTRPTLPCFKSRFSATRTLGLSPRWVDMPFSKMKVSSPMSHARKTRSRPMATVFTQPGRRTPVWQILRRNWRIAFIPYRDRVRTSSPRDRGFAASRR